MAQQRRNSIQAQIQAALADEAALRAALQDADIAPLLMVLVQLSGDQSWLARLAPHIAGPWNFLESAPEALRQELRDAVVAELRRHAAADAPAPALPTDALLQQMMTAGTGQEVPAEYLPLLKEEMRFTAADARWVDWHAARPAAAADSPVIIVGAGLGGIALGIQLKRLGIPFTILDKNQDIGGTWLENSYPGCAVDTPNHFFSYSFRPNDGWTRHFSGRDEILAYLKDTVAEYGLRPHIRFGVTVTGARFDGTGWQVATQDAEGRQQTLPCRVLVTAVGQLNRPAIPDIPGLADFPGPCFHTAQWDHGVDLTGRRVALIGTGASAMQAGPSIAPDVQHLTVFQRAAHWVVHNPNYHRSVKPGHIWLLRHLPFYSQWLRFQLFWASSDGFHATLKVDPAWPQPAISLNERNHAMREMLVAHMRQELEGDEALLAKVTPSYPPYGKRMLRDNYWFRMLKRPNVTLETGRIARIAVDAIEMQDGTRHPVDAIVLATGFQASRMLAPMDIQGRGGRSIRDAWGDDDPRAYLGMTAPGFPNLFMLYGPNTNLAHGGSIIFHTECQVRYIAQALRHMLEAGTPLLEVRQEVHDAYNARLDDVARNMVWTHPGVNSWYKNKHNRLTVTSPWRLLDYWRMTRQFAPADFHLGELSRAA